MSDRYDVAIVGAGILGLAHAYHLARQGKRVAVFERGKRAEGASIRNFGMLWPIGQPAGPARNLALRSLEIWHDVLGESGLWHERTGSLHLAYHDDEYQVLHEFLTSNPGHELTMIDPQAVRNRAPAVRWEGLQGALWSPLETCMDPRLVIAGLPPFLHDRYGVDFHFETAMLGYDCPHVRTSVSEWSADRLIVCAGDDFQSLFPAAFRASGLVRCKLQMMRAQPATLGWRLGPMLAAGSTLRHYRAFEACPTLPSLHERFARERPAFDTFGIHVMASQNGLGELVLGDSHEYGDAIEPFNKQEIDDLILEYLATFLEMPPFQISARWHGTYAKHPSEPYFVARPAPGVTIVTGVGGAGMTLSFGLAEKIVKELLKA